MAEAFLCFISPAEFEVVFRQNIDGEVLRQQKGGLPDGNRLPHNFKNTQVGKSSRK